MKKFSIVIAAVLLVSLLAGCAGTPVVYYTNCTCPVAEQNVPSQTQPPVVTEGALKTGLYIIGNAAKSENATAEKDGTIEYDVTVVAVLVDENGVIADCIIDSIGAKATISAAGQITSDVTAQILSKNELGEDYNMKKYGNAKYEWNEQAAALADYAVGKTLEELKNGAVNETGYAADADLASTATIYLGGYVSAIEGAVNNAKHLGAQSGDTLKMATTATLSSSSAAEAEKAGNMQLDVDATALTVQGDVITSCYIDSLQAKVAFGTDGVITTDLTAPMPTKNELGDGYNMKLYAGAKYEWYEQAASFAAYVTGKTAADVAGIAVAEGKPSDADLAATVTIAIGGFQALIAKACQ